MVYRWVPSMMASFSIASSTPRAAMLARSDAKCSRVGGGSTWYLVVLSVPTLTLGKVTPLATGLVAGLGLGSWRERGEHVWCRVWGAWRCRVAASKA